MIYSLFTANCTLYPGFNCPLCIHYRFLRALLESGYVEQIRRGYYGWIEDEEISDAAIITKLFPDAIRNVLMNSGATVNVIADIAFSGAQLKLACRYLL